MRADGSASSTIAAAAPAIVKAPLCFIKRKPPLLHAQICRNHYVIDQGDFDGIVYGSRGAEHTPTPTGGAEHTPTLKRANAAHGAHGSNHLNRLKAARAENVRTTLRKSLPGQVKSLPHALPYAILPFCPYITGGVFSERSLFHFPLFSHICIYICHIPIPPTYSLIFSSYTYLPTRPLEFHRSCTPFNRLGCIKEGES